MNYTGPPFNPTPGVPVGELFFGFVIGFAGLCILFILFMEDFSRWFSSLKGSWNRWTEVAKKNWEEQMAETQMIIQAIKDRHEELKEAKKEEKKK